MSSEFRYFPDGNDSSAVGAPTIDELRRFPTYTAMSAAMVERIFRHYGGAVSARLIRIVVGDCILDLVGSPTGVLPELAERLATQRVADLLLEGVDNILRKPTCPDHAP